MVDRMRWPDQLVVVQLHLYLDRALDGYPLAGMYVPESQEQGLR